MTFETKSRGPCDVTKLEISLFGKLQNSTFVQFSKCPWSATVHFTFVLRGSRFLIRGSYFLVRASQFAVRSSWWFWNRVGALSSLGPSPFPLITRGREERVWRQGLAQRGSWNAKSCNLQRG